MISFLLSHQAVFQILVVACIPIYFQKWANLNFNKFFYVKCSKTNSTIRNYRWGGFIPVLPSLASSFILRLKGFHKNDVHNRGKLEETFKKSSEVCAKRTGVRGKRQAKTKIEGCKQSKSQRKKSFPEVTHNCF